MMTTRPTKLLLLFTVLFIAIACQDDQFEKEIDPIDEDMLAAIEMADEYLSSQGARAEQSVRSITVLKFYDDQLYFNTNTDTIPGYQVIEETSITAYAEPGQFVFWYSGGGVTDLGEIDFDETAEEFLEELPDEVKDGFMWAIQMPTDVDTEVEEILHLKYDIIYETRDSTSPIRLDPLIKVTGHVEEEPEEEPESN